MVAQKKFSGVIYHLHLTLSFMQPQANSSSNGNMGRAEASVLAADVLIANYKPYIQTPNPTPSFLFFLPPLMLTPEDDSVLQPYVEQLYSCTACTRHSLSRIPREASAWT